MNISSPRVLPYFGLTMPSDTWKWFAVQTRPRYEKKVAAELQKKQIDIFLPLSVSTHQWTDRQRIIQSPLFQSYVFIRIPDAADTRLAVLRTNGVTNFVGVRGTGIPIPECEIEAVRILLTRGVPFQFHPFLNVGQRVRIVGGSLDGLQGLLVAKNDDQTLVVSIHLMQRSLSVRVGGYRIEAA
jgi:transcription antitermination factor NusG